MAYYLNNPSSGTVRVLVPSVIIGETAGDYIEIKAVANAGNPGSNYRLAGRINSGFDELIEVGGTRVYFRAKGLSASGREEASFTSGFVQPAVGDEFTLRLTRTSLTQWACSLNSVQLGSPQNLARSFNLTALMSFATDRAEAFRGGIYHVDISTNGGASSTYYYDPSASNGTGLILPDTVGGNNGTLVNFPTDDSQWVFYGAPSSDVDSTINATWPSLAISADQQSTVPALESSVNVAWPGLAITANQTAQAPEFSSTVAAQWPSLSVQAAQTATAPVYTANAAITWPNFTINASQGAQVPDVDSSTAITWPALSVAASQASTLPAYDSSVAVTWPSLSISANQSQQLPEGATTVNVTWPNLSVSASQASTVPVFESVAAFTWPSLTVSVTQVQELPIGGASVSVQWPSFSVNAAQESTIPEYTATINLTWPSFSVSIFAGEFDYFNDPTARIDLPAESRRLDLPFESRRIDL